MQVILNTFVIITAVTKINCADDLLIRKDGSYKYGYAGPDSFHESQANRNNVVRGKFGGRNPETGILDTSLNLTLLLRGTIFL